MLMGISSVMINGCKKEPPAPTKKTYTIEYDVTCISGGGSYSFTIYYITNGNTYTKTIVGTQDWTTSFTASTGDYVSMKCAPPYGGSGTVSAVSLAIKYNGSLLLSKHADGNNFETADANATLP